MTKVLVVLTNTTRYQHTDAPTGLWLGEAAEFVDAMQQANIAVDYVSPHDQRHAPSGFCRGTQRPHLLKSQLLDLT